MSAPLSELKRYHIVYSPAAGVGEGDTVTVGVGVGVAVGVGVGEGWMPMALELTEIPSTFTSLNGLTDQERFAFATSAV